MVEPRPRRLDAVGEATVFLKDLAVKQIRETRHRAQSCGCAGCKGQARQTEEWWTAPISESKRRNPPAQEGI